MRRVNRRAVAIRATSRARSRGQRSLPRLAAQLQPEPLAAPRWPFKDLGGLAQADGFPRAGPLNQTLQLVGLAAVKDPGNDDGPADGFIRVEHSPVPHTETPRVLQRPFQALDLPDLALCISINRLR